MWALERIAQLESGARRALPAQNLSLQLDSAPALAQTRRTSARTGCPFGAATKKLDLTVAQMVGALFPSAASLAPSQLAKGFGRQALVGLSCLRSIMTLWARIISFVGLIEAYETRRKIAALIMPRIQW